MKTAVNDTPGYNYNKCIDFNVDIMTLLDVYDNETVQIDDYQSIKGLINVYFALKMGYKIIPFMGIHTPRSSFKIYMPAGDGMWQYGTRATNLFSWEDVFIAVPDYVGTIRCFELTKLVDRDLHLVSNDGGDKMWLANATNNPYANQFSNSVGVAVCKAIAYAMNVYTL